MLMLIIFSWSSAAAVRRLHVIMPGVLWMKNKHVIVNLVSARKKRQLNEASLTRQTGCRLRKTQR